MMYIPIQTMLRALKAQGMTDREVGALIGLNASNVCRLRNGHVRDTTSSVYFALFALWKEKAGGNRDRKSA